MKAIQSINELREIRRSWQIAGETIGFVPTMGNLHKGHLTLVEQAKKECSIVVVSIFINPLQFGPNEDLDAYPRTLEADKAALEALGVDVLFIPQVKDIYPRGLEQQTFVEVPGVSYMICGASRPGHFRGVATIVSKLFNMVQPNHAYFGTKDFQQLQIIRTMVQDLSMNLTIHGVDTVREADGLAMSSRNNYLSASEREQAPALYRVLSGIEQELKLGNQNFKALMSKGCDALNQAGFKADYIEIRVADTLMPPYGDDKELVILAAAFLGRTRLIDNIPVSL